MVPIVESIKARDLFQSLGADVQFSDGKGGHKVTVPALRELNNFIRD
jgi:predicted esterase